MSLSTNKHVLYDDAGNPLVGQKPMATSVPVTLASDQTAIPISILAASAVPGIAFGDIVLSSITTVAIRRTAYTEQVANFQGSVVSSSASDAAAGTGARTIKITYLDSTGAGPSTETVTLNGVTPVNLVALTHCFIEKIEVVTVGSTGGAVGTITLFTGLAGGGTAVGTIAAGDRRTYWVHHYVPTGKTCKVTGMDAGSSSTAAGSGSIYRLRHKLLAVANAVEIEVSEDFTLYGQSSSAPRPFNAPLELAGPARVAMYVTTTANPTFTYRGAFDYFDL